MKRLKGLPGNQGGFGITCAWDMDANSPRAVCHSLASGFQGSFLRQLLSESLFIGFVHMGLKGA